MAQDALSQILDVLRMRGTIYFHTHFNPPWGVRVPTFKNVARFHMVIRGHCWVRVDGIDEPIPLSSGDIILVPHGAEHTLSEPCDSRSENVDEIVCRSGYTGDGALVYGGDDNGLVCKLFCGHFEFDEGVMHPILSALPKVIHLPNTETMNAQWLEAVMRFVSSEVLGGKAGADAIAYRLSEIIFIQVVRAFVDKAGSAAGCLAGILDPQLSKSLSAIHLEPQKLWTVETMAIEAGMSRTQFAERFNSLIGITPLSYLTHWRMLLARRQLVESNRPLIDIAEAVGYGSEAAFGRAFKRHFDMAPGSLRRNFC